MSPHRVDVTGVLCSRLGLELTSMSQACKLSSTTKSYPKSSCELRLSSIESCRHAGLKLLWAKVADVNDYLSLQQDDNQKNVNFALFIAKFPDDNLWSTLMVDHSFQEATGGPDWFA